ncbi:MAG: type II toxin-antitoxin system Phd/YefM family antitoxin [Endomicrobiales bacterium]|jgi:prevent-host-death family protein
MRTFAAKQAKDHFGLLLDTAQHEPVMIEKKNRKVAVLISTEEYTRLGELEDLYWASKADIAIKDGFIGKKHSEKLLKDILHAKD